MQFLNQQSQRTAGLFGIPFAGIAGFGRQRQHPQRVPPGWQNPAQSRHRHMLKSVMDRMDWHC